MARTHPSKMCPATAIVANKDDHKRHDSGKDDAKAANPLSIYGAKNPLIHPTAL